MANAKVSLSTERSEPLYEYHPGGYHPVHIGDQISERYTVVDKLGWGAFSTVWLASDRQNGDACVVISVSKASAAHDYRQELMPKMQILQSGDDSHPGKKNLLFPLDSFSITGPNGEHFCLVMSFEGQTISRATNRAQGSDTRPLALPQAKRAVVDLGNGVSYMHTLRMTHNDLHPANLYLGIPDGQPWTAEKFEKVCGKPKTIATNNIEDKPSSENVPKYLVRDALTYDVDHNLFKGPFKIADFGLAFRWDQVRPKMSSAGPYIVPELNASDVVRGAADVWMFGCAIYQFLSGFDLMGTIDDPAEKMVHQIMEVLGQPPRWMLESWQSLLGDTAIKPIETPTRPLATCMKDLHTGNEQKGMKPRLGDFSEEDISVLTEFLTFILHLDPAQRPSIDEVLGHPAMNYFRA